MKHQREHWGSRLGFIFAAAGSAIGLGSLWRFPYIAGSQGGGAFVLLYLIFTFAISLPVFTGELIIGRASQKGSVGAFASQSSGSSNWKLAGYMTMLTSFIILSYYSVVSGWCLNYVVMSINSFWKGRSPDEIRNVFTIMDQSADINLFWLFIFLLINVGILYSGVRRGIEKWSRILMPILLAIILGLLIYESFLPGFKDALRFIFNPDFSKLTPNNILDALGMAFFTLSVGLGIIITYGSYVGENENIPKTGVLISLMTVAISLIAALIIFPVVFTFHFSPQGGPGLIFQTIPVLFARLPAALLLSTLFFALVVFTALTSSISLLEVLVANLMEIKNIKRSKAVIAASIAVFLFAIPCALAGTKLLFPNWSFLYGKNFFDTMDYITASWMMPINGLLSTLFVGYRMKKEDVQEEFIKQMRHPSLYYLWRFFVRYLAPAAVIVILLNNAGLLSVFTGS